MTGPRFAVSIMIRKGAPSPSREADVCAERAKVVRAVRADAWGEEDLGEASSD